MIIQPSEQDANSNGPSKSSQSRFDQKRPVVQSTVNTNCITRDAQNVFDKKKQRMEKI